MLFSNLEKSILSNCYDFNPSNFFNEMNEIIDKSCSKEDDFKAEDSVKSLFSRYLSDWPILTCSNGEYHYRWCVPGYERDDFYVKYCEKSNMLCINLAKCDGKGPSFSYKTTLRKNADKSTFVVKCEKGILDFSYKIGKKIDEDADFITIK